MATGPPLSPATQLIITVDANGNMNIQSSVPSVEMVERILAVALSNVQVDLVAQKALAQIRGERGVILVPPGALPPANDGQKP